MAYNINNVKIIAGGPLWIPIDLVLKAREAHKDNLPEINFLEDGALKLADENGVCEIEHLRWSGEGSGRSYELFVELLGLATGSADLILTWEGGDSLTGLRVRDGVVNEHHVIQALGDEV